jgi:all-trans-retinol 13,14-reductase
VHHLNFDTVVIGSGLGGLLCANILALEGQRVCVLEKNEQIGGNLQTFRRDGVVFDTGVHYISALDKGQQLYKIFKYLNVYDRLVIKKLDNNAFDNILFRNTDEVFSYGMSFEKFIAILTKKFPEEKSVLVQYVNDINEICTMFPMYNLNDKDEYGDESIFSLSLYSYFERLTSNKLLRAVLVGTNILYAGDGDKTPFYVHALMINSYIEGAWKCKGGGDQIAKLLAKNIKSLNGKIFRNHEVKKIIEQDGKVTYIETSNNKKFYARNFLSNIDPFTTLDMTESKLIRNIYKHRIGDIPNTIGAFTLYIVLVPKLYPYSNKNYFYFDDTEVLNAIQKSNTNWPYTYALFEIEDEKNPEFSKGISVMTYMSIEECRKWESTFNTTTLESSRGEDYEQFKERKSQELLNLIFQKFPLLESCIKSYYSSTPLSYRDYIGNRDGNIYGIAKDYKEPLKNRISPVTKIPNLFFTGANINLHGVLGVSISALVTSSLLVGKKYLLDKINSVYE